MWKCAIPSTFPSSTPAVPSLSSATPPTFFLCASGAMYDSAMVVTCSPVVCHGKRSQHHVSELLQPQHASRRISLTGILRLLMRLLPHRKAAVQTITIAAVIPAAIRPVTMVGTKGIVENEKLIATLFGSPLAAEFRERRPPPRLSSELPSGGLKLMQMSTSSRMSTFQKICIVWAVVSASGSSGGASMLTMVCSSLHTSHS